MKVHEEVFLSLVRNSLWDTQVEVPVEFKDWNLVMRLAEIQAMQGFVAKGLLDSPAIIARMKPGAESRLSNMLMTNVVMHSMTNSSLKKIVMALHDADIECVLLKGQGLATNYPQPEVRECGDIDLYVGVENYNKAYQAIKHVADKIDDPTVLENGGKHFHAVLSGISVEIHKFTEVLSSESLNKVYQKYEVEGLTQNLVELEVGENKVMTPSDNFNAFYIFNHLWSHFLTNGCGIRQLCDWTMFLHTRGEHIDRKYLHKVLTDMDLISPWQTFGCVVVDILGLPSAEFPFYDRKYRKNAVRVFERILLEGDMGRETEFIRNGNRGYLFEKYISAKFYIKRFFFLSGIFPSHAVQQLTHSICNGFGRLIKDFTRKIR